MNNLILKTISLSKSFGGIQALNKVDLSLNKGDILGLIGPNGAGKTTLFNLIAGQFNPSSGQIIFENKDITHFRPDKVAKVGIARTFQIVQVFNNLSVLENVLAGALFGHIKITVYLDSIYDAYRALEFIGK